MQLHCLTHGHAVQRFASQVNMMFATQSLLYALGIGATRALPAGAAINWMLKEGLGKLARMTVATSFAHNFDSQVKVRIIFVCAVRLYCTAAMNRLCVQFEGH